MKKLHFCFSRAASRALSRAVGNPATGILPVYRNSFGVRINLVSSPEREREREREGRVGGAAMVCMKLCRCYI